MIKEKDWIYTDKIKLPDDITLFAIGDIHGDIDAFTEMTDYVDKKYPQAKKITVGDLIDRGPGSIDCINFALDNYDHYIPGNHELLLIGTLHNLDHYADVFFNNGGIWLYELFSEKYSKNKSFNDIIKLEIKNYQKFYQYGKLTPTTLYDPTLHAEYGNLIFIHAGIKPGMNYKDFIYGDNAFNLSNDNPVWIREKFLNHKTSYCKNDDGDDVVVVHGHSFEHYIDHLPTDKYPSGKFPWGHTEMDGYRLGLDTGGYVTKIHTGAIFENGRYKIINRWVV